MNPEAVITDDGVFWLYACLLYLGAAWYLIWGLLYLGVIGYLVWEDFISYCMEERQ